MAVLLWGIIVGVVGFAIHFVLWHIRLPQRHLRAIAIIFFGTMVAVLAAQWFLGDSLFGGLPCLDELPEVVSFFIFCVACVFAYMITYTSFEVDSPTEVMVDRIDRSGDQGLPVGAMDDLISNEQMVKVRVLNLVRDRMLIEENGAFRMTPKGRRFIWVFDTYRRLLGRPRGG
ncbi:MAG TPA: hypothetical protein PLO37_12875 [Candidatus Hydrogenedentes bacterium]|nr:hypothetical protein [Candidatus Hydrogenedentota bacterium]HPG67736.1 hypothetical protein [Candidatus Hydrogenedentota bacterium]